MSNENWNRYSPASVERNETDKRGRLFVNEKGKCEEVTAKIIYSSVDTIRQLYRGLPKLDILQKIDDLSSEGEAIWTFQGRETTLPYEGKRKTDVMSPYGAHWLIRRMGKKSGYRFCLQNNEIGLVIMFGSYYAKTDQEGAHLKIECSPWFINARGNEEINYDLDWIANDLLQEARPAGVAVHLAVDIQGWKPDETFRNRYVTRARAVQEFRGMDSLKFDSLTTVSATYGDLKTLTYGKPASLQQTVYCKSDQIKAEDLEDYYHARFDEYTFGQWDPEQEVFRAEMRFHHSVTRDLMHYQEKPADHWRDIAPYLADLWNYATTNNYLSYNPRYVDPLWQMIREDADFHVPAQGMQLKRKKKESMGNTAKNIGLMLGNLITLMARKGYDAAAVMANLQGLQIWDDIESYYETRKLSIEGLEDWIAEGIQRRCLIKHVSVA